MTDRNVEHPNRYQLVAVAGEPSQFDLVPVPGTVMAEGTNLTKLTLLQDSTATALGLDPGDDPTLDNAFNNLAVLKGTSSPPPGTDGVVGQYYIDTTTPQLYQCTVASGGIYIWTKIGMAQVTHGSYTGTGDYGVSESNTLNFEFEVQMLIVQRKTTSTFGSWSREGAANWAVMINGISELRSFRNSITTLSSVYVEFGASSVSWYSVHADNQLNRNGSEYEYVAIGVN